MATTPDPEQPEETATVEATAPEHPVGPATAESADPAEPMDGADAKDVPEPGNGDTPEKARGKFFVVGIGASAGGLEALGELIEHIPLAGMAFVVVQHLAPDHESLLTQLLSRNARIRVVTAADGMPLEPVCVYVIPPNADLAIRDGVIRLATPSGAKGRHLPVDYLFRSLAEDQGHSAIGIVLSGTGTDGTLGLQAIRAAGGFTFCQEPSTARHHGMPQSALASGAADYCLAPREIGEELSRIAQHPHARRTARAAEPAPEARAQLGRLFALFRSEFGHDLTQYKPATIDRRIERRMMFHKLERLDDYVRHVQRDRAELQALYKDILIPVTHFFRDPEVFEALKRKILVELVERKKPNPSIRVWVPACATGEEAYSIAMCLLEVCEGEIRDDRIQIFATDVDEDSVEHARRGVYPAHIAQDVSSERLHRFFVKKDDALQVSRRIRDRIVFSRHNLLRDAPFSRLDLVSCRNLLIYLQPSEQKKVLRIFRYALEPTGHLLLGTSETAGDAPELFSTVDRKHKIYAKRFMAPQAALEIGFGWPEPRRERATARPVPNLQELADRKVLDLYGPPGVVVSENLDILQFRGHTGPYLDPTPGAASLNILKVARFDLHIALKRALHQARTEQQRVTTDVAYREDGKRCLLRIDVAPVQDREANTRCWVVLFHRLPAPKEIPVVSAEPGAGDVGLHPLALRIEELERELAVTREYLQAMTEEKERTLEELQSANEDLQSSNEELQSTNEELQTSKEEMQSTNEELTTVNEELQSRMMELSQTNDDLYNVLTGVDNAVVIVGMDLRIRRYTSAAEKLFHLVPGDIGRSIGALDSFLGTRSLEPTVATVIQSLSTLEEEVLGSNQRWYALRISPYKTLDHAIRGALITLSDIDVRKRAVDMTRDVGAYAAKFLGAIDHPLLIVDRKQHVIWANNAFLSTFQLSVPETVGIPLASLGGRQLADPGLRDRLEAVFASASLLRGYEMRFQSPEGGWHAARMGASLIPASTDVPLALVSIEAAHPPPSGAEP